MDYEMGCRSKSNHRGIPMFKQSFFIQNSGINYFNETSKEKFMVKKLLRISRRKLKLIANRK